MRVILLYLLKIYQKFFTLIGFGSCRYYPSCSEYAKWQFEQNSIHFALFHSIVRILKCNQLFDGGFDYPIVEKKFSNTQYRLPQSRIKYWFIPIKNSKKFYLVKNIF